MLGFAVTKDYNEGSLGKSTGELMKVVVCVLCRWQH